MIRKIHFFWLKTIIAKLLCHPLIGRMLSGIFHDQIPIYGLTVDTRSHVIQPKTKAELFWGIYEGAEVRFIRRYLTPGLDMVELGSSLGVTACIIRRQMGDIGRLVCVEANPELIGIINRNLEINIPTLPVTVLNKAVDYSGTGPVWLTFGVDSASSAICQPASSPKGQGTYVSAITLSEILREYQIRDFNLICDIEGAETAMLMQDGESLKGCRLVIIELHTTNYNGQEVLPAQLCEQLVDNHGFKIRDQYGPVFVFERPDPGR